MPEEKLRVFISWSGDLSRAVATALRDWVPTLFDGVDPWMSDADIASGARGLDEIHSTLAGCTFGVIVVTEENQHSAWLNYEAGAISKSIADSQSRVVPLLVDLSSPTQLTGPLAQFQARKLDRTDLLRVVETIATQVEISSDTARQRFSAFWPHLEGAVQTALDSHRSKHGAKAKRSMEDMLEEVLTQVRELTRSVDASPSSKSHLSSRVLSYLGSLDHVGLEMMENSDPGIGERGHYVSTIARTLMESIVEDKWSPRAERTLMRPLSQLPPLPGATRDVAAAQVEALGSAAWNAPRRYAGEPRQADSTTPV